MTQQPIQLEPASLAPGFRVSPNIPVWRVILSRPECKSALDADLQLSALLETPATSHVPPLDFLEFAFTAAEDLEERARQLTFFEGAHGEEDFVQRLVGKVDRLDLGPPIESLVATEIRVCQRLLWEASPGESYNRGLLATMIAKLPADLTPKNQPLPSPDRLRIRAMVLGEIVEENQPTMEAWKALRDVLPAEVADVVSWPPALEAAATWSPEQEAAAAEKATPQLFQFRGPDAAAREESLVTSELAAPEGWVVTIRHWLPSKDANKRLGHVSAQSDASVEPGVQLAIEIVEPLDKTLPIDEGLSPTWELGVTIEEVVVRLLKVDASGVTIEKGDLQRIQISTR